MSLLILGAGGHGTVVKEIALAIGNSAFANVAFLDDNNPGAIAKFEQYRDFLDSYTYAFAAIGNPKIREEWFDKLTEAGYKIPTLIHPSAYISPTAILEKGVIIMPNVVIQANAHIGIGTIISSGAIVDHDAKVGNYCHINAGAVVGSGKQVPDSVRINYLSAVL